MISYRIFAKNKKIQNTPITKNIEKSVLKDITKHTSGTPYT